MIQILIIPKINSDPDIPFQIRDLDCPAELSIREFDPYPKSRPSLVQTIIIKIISADREKTRGEGERGGEGRGRQ